MKGRHVLSEMKEGWLGRDFLLHFHELIWRLLIYRLLWWIIFLEQESGESSLCYTRWISYCKLSSILNCDKIKVPHKWSKFHAFQGRQQRPGFLAGSVTNSRCILESPGKLLKECWCLGPYFQTFSSILEYLSVISWI